MRKALAAAFILASSAAAGESYLRHRFGQPPDETAWTAEMRFLDKEIRKPFFIPRSANAGTLWTPNRPRSTATSFVDPKPQGLTRIFVVGESVAQRLEPSVLKQAFAETRAGEFEVINCGMGAYDSARVARVVDDILHHDPDLIVVLTGNNGGGPEIRSFEAWRLNQLLRRLWFWRLPQDSLRKALSRPRDRAAGLARFNEDLGHMARAAKSRGVPLVLCTLPANERDWPPTGELPLNEPDFFAGWLARQEGRKGEAVDRFQAFARRQPEEAMGRFWLAKALDEAGKGEQARGEYAAALERDWPDRAGADKNAVIRRAAAEQGAKLADLEPYFRSLAHDGTPGWESFLDGVHWRSGLNTPVSRLIAQAASDLPAQPGRPSPPGADDARAAALHAVSDALQAAMEYRPPILSERAVAEFGLVQRLDAGLARSLAENPSQARQAFETNAWTGFLLTQAPQSWAGVYLHAGEAHFRAGRRERALDYFRRAVKLDPGSALARLLSAKALFAMGRKADADRELEAIAPGRRELVLADLYRQYYDSRR